MSMYSKFIRYLLAISLAFFLLMQSAFATESATAYWSTQRKGSNIFNENVSNEIWKSAADANIKLVRLAPDKWHGKGKDFLIGDADNYDGLIAEDLNQLKQVLADANKNGVKVILTMMSLPGNRWKQLNANHDDDRLWRDEKYQQQTIHFWTDLVKALEGDPAIVGYNVINEPHPETALGYQDFTKQDFQEFSNKTSGTLVDLTVFYQKIVTAIRQVDENTPIILDVGMYADPRAFSYFKPVQGKHILYAFHMYEPYSYTNKKLNNGKYIYPGKIPIGKNQPLVYMDKNHLQSIYLEPVIRWQQQYHIPSTQIIVEEFGGNRMSKGLDKYFHDLIEIFNANGWHWGFYSFREDTWNGMDYEIGTKPLGAAYWDALSRGEHPQVKRVPNSIWSTLSLLLK